MFGRELYYPRRPASSFMRFPSWMDFDDLGFDDDWPFERPRFPRRSRRSLFDDMHQRLQMPDPEFDFGPQMSPSEVRVKLLPDGRMAITGNSEQSHVKNGTTFRSSNKFYRSMDVPDDLDVGYLQSMMDQNNELTIQRQQPSAVTGSSSSSTAVPAIEQNPQERIIEVQIDGRKSS